MKIGKTQDQMVLQHLLNGNALSHLEAIKYYGAMRLSSIIHRLRTKHGYGKRIVSIRKKDQIGQTYTSYRFKR